MFNQSICTKFFSFRGETRKESFFLLHRASSNFPEWKQNGGTAAIEVATADYYYSSCDSSFR